jgi:multicomponent Na+:H+ antiporter subunit G
MTGAHVIAAAAGWGVGGPLVTGAGVRDGLAVLALLGGAFFMFVGALGVFRFPDAYARMHAASKCTTLGLTGLLLSAMLHLWMLDIGGKAVLVVVFTFVATPIGTHLLAKAAHHGGARQFRGTLSDELAEDKADPRRTVTDDRIDGEMPEALGDAGGDLRLADARDGSGAPATAA